MATSMLPEYPLPAGDPPAYTSSPLADERTVAHNPRPGSSRNQTGQYVKTWKQATLILKDQDENARFPVYSRGGLVDGEIGLTCPEGIIEVSAKLFGQMSVMAADCGSTGAVVVCDSRVLWTQEDPKDRCPSILPFAIRFPYTFTDPNGKTCKLPPSFETHYMGIPALFAKVVYTLTISITKTRRYALASWTSSRMFTAVLDYRPRTRPQRPIVMVDSIFDSIKPIPEEWQQHILTMEPRSDSGPGANAGGIECHFLIPSVQIYSITDSIPFHLQLCGSRESLNELLPPNSSLLDPRLAGDSKRKESLDLSPTGPHPIRVYLARQIHVEVNGRKRYRTYTVGTSQMWPVPPVITRDGVEHSNVGNEVSLDWQGELKCRTEAMTASFYAGLLMVKDFIVVGLAPYNIRSSFLLPVQLAYPVRLVTDSWVDQEVVHPQDL
ncbi:hypothetical protein CC1G_04535 [Coprinopsis cinerea okayama7|uniref:Arrestin-like N-terminal domain-containing protein n=1 Tax=Coprinopsis cinerea (strain Okayama-7 / 130 / ATCC MYA-4618 / FGSC 9003) TaxID=240176 RepID=A8N5F7_COPC7|nr:hypothetical protein CC1G_04535 [Coprinopsis cinerea okayama7\|eukprot:XP_001830102.2 hypothetical protein CC1G_04535 [Coprinopsis cinerea okayama7\